MDRANRISAKNVVRIIIFSVGGLDRFLVPVVRQTYLV